mmetsp:Transcript_13743/g.27433  ORF Transcript_13743/g.27433 Transcript_13743/m.27433 type:complete len:390 (+) Transcript_13743:90-1259(+)|eukprot:CAMPEP_0194306132 /NCGR_PEP_ID=MMETSP0171-20130528/3387_1 /TAXON_ID=218684 /ORGANISM="Corethron pennatum, Strain L29A3" /LENGTH=389 /DNA_ID=CAMNT_0039057853 /DNA_START=90 /DNA_END=1259 /DNA_ORIENTATION=+
MKSMIQKSSFLAMLVATPGLFTSQVHAQTAETGAPTTTFEGQNFTIAEPKVTFTDNGSTFELDFSYPVGKSVYTSSTTLYKEDCEDTNDVDELLNWDYVGTDTSNSQYDVIGIAVSVVKANITKSPLRKYVVGNSQDSKGSINFCIKIEGNIFVTDDETLSVSFRKTNVRLDYDLTDNTFSVTNNAISADAIKETNTTVDTVYEVDAFRCGTGSSDFIDITATAGTINQNDLVGICLKPKTPAVVEISTFDMFFRQNDSKVYTAATLKQAGPEAGAVSQYLVSSDKQTHKIVSRLISNLFKNEGDKFNVDGNAYLQFVSSSPDTRKTNLRMLEDISEGSAGDSPFSLTMKIAKVAGAGDSKETKNYHSFPMIGAALIIAIGFVLYKKLA